MIFKKIYILYILTIIKFNLLSFYPSARRIKQLTAFSRIKDSSIELSISSGDISTYDFSSLPINSFNLYISSHNLIKNSSSLSYSSIISIRYGTNSSQTLTGPMIFAIDVTF